ncbi:ABC transporter permease [Thioalkalivibrio sp. HK1]|uniref:ABC transporter permease n=1 Tax=Thioalkalivibrio sp. HK1 TaxID=1469245 RepID=UPI000687C6FF|nr:iron ABC transporter permease [Thioalkalivibrio sp. HK1]
MPRRMRPDLWVLIALLIGALIAIPLGSILFVGFGPSSQPDSGIWAHLVSTVLWDYLSNTLLLMVGVGIGTVLLGASTAWLVTMYRFPGRSILSWALLLPLAVPGYILAFVITDQLEYAGTVQSALRAWFGWSSARDYYFPEIRSLGGAAIVLSLVLYPYVYLLARASFIEQGTALFEAGRCLGKGALSAFLTVALPLARPAIVVGASLALMETLNEYGTIDFFAVPTLAAGIFDVWLNMDRVRGAAQLASMLAAFALCLVALERISRKGRRFHDTTRRGRPPLTPTSLTGPSKIVASIWCALPVLLGFVLPALVLARYAIEFYAKTLDADYLDFVINSVFLAAWAALLTTAIGVALAYGVRLSSSRPVKSLAEFATIGYAIPGAVLAVGIVAPLGHIDRALDFIATQIFGMSSVGLLLSGTVVSLIVGYTVRFMALGYRTMDAGLARITPAIEGAARTLGASPSRSFAEVHFPLLRPSVSTAALLVFVDTMKELPLTLILRPFNYETLATFVYRYASDELLEECALGALTIVAAGIVPVILMSRAVASMRNIRR